MFKIWAKLINEDKKLIKDVIYTNDERFDIENFGQYVTDIAGLLDIATPLTLVYHTNNFDKFSYVKYLPRDFVEKVDFNSLLLENGNC